MVFETYILPILIFIGLGLVAGTLLTISSKFLAVKVDKKLEKLQSALPQINCGACGYSGCDGYAVAILNDNVDANLCKPGGDDTARLLSEIAGVEFKDVESQIACVKCRGNCHFTTEKYTFEGAPTCAGARRYYSGSKTCTNGCLGFGDCIQVCPEDAIHLNEGIAFIDKDKCIGCGLCVKTCPNNLIVIKPITHKIEVACHSTSIGKVTKSVCKVGCIGCKICQKNCPEEAITVENNFASINYDKCTQCGICMDKCPVGTIVEII